MEDIIKYQAVEIAVPAAGGTGPFYFPDQPQLAGCQIQAIEIYTITSVTLGPLSGGTPVSVADMKKCSVTFYWEAEQIIQNIPLLRLNKMVTADPYVNVLEGLAGQSISWTKSYIKFATAATAAATVVVFGIYYSGAGRS